MLDVLLVDDEAAGRRALREYCTLEPNICIVGEYGDGSAALDAIHARRPQVVFLDIKMDVMDGITLVRSLDAGAPPLIVFVTAYDHYAIEAFELSAVDYLLKPFDRERFQKMVERVRRRVAVEGAAQRREALDAAIERLEQAQHARVEESPRVLVGLGSTLRMLEVARIEIATAERNYVRLNVGNDTYHLRGTLQQTEKALHSQPTLRVSRSCLVNLNHVREISRTPRGDFILVLAGGATVTSSESFRDPVRRHLEQFKVVPECATSSS